MEYGFTQTRNSLPVMSKYIRRVVKAALGTLLGVLPSPNDPANPERGLYLRWRYGWIKGLFCRLWLHLRAACGGTRFQLGKRLSVQGTLRLRGPGTVILGDDVVIGQGMRTDIYTHAPDAMLTIGDRTFLNGTRFGCACKISVGADCILADARIMDTDFHAVSRDRRRRSAPIATAPVIIGKNVWIAASAAVLKGVTIGENTVVAFGAIVTKDIPPDTIVAGNPARVIGEVH